MHIRIPGDPGLNPNYDSLFSVHYPWTRYSLTISKIYSAILPFGSFSQLPAFAKLGMNGASASVEYSCVIPDSMQFPVAIGLDP